MARLGDLQHNLSYESYKNDLIIPQNRKKGHKLIIWIGFTSVFI